MFSKMSARIVGWGLRSISRRTITAVVTNRRTSHRGSPLAPKSRERSRTLFQPSHPSPGASEFELGSLASSHEADLGGHRFDARWYSGLIARGL